MFEEVETFADIEDQELRHYNQANFLFNLIEDIARNNTQIKDLALTRKTIMADNMKEMHLKYLLSLQEGDRLPVHHRYMKMLGVNNAK